MTSARFVMMACSMYSRASSMESMDTFSDESEAAPLARVGEPCAFGQEAVAWVYHAVPACLAALLVGFWPTPR